MSEPSDEEDGATHSVSKRHWLTNDGIAWLLTVSSIGLVVGAGIGMLDLGNVPAELLLVFVASFGTAIAWAFGRDALEAWRGDS